MEFAADAAKPANRWRGDPVHRRPAGRQRAMDYTRARPVLRLCRPGHRPGQRRGRRPSATRTRSRSRSPGTVKKVVFDLKPHVSDQDEFDLHAVRHQGHVGHGCRPENAGGVLMLNDDDTTDVLIGGYLSSEAADEDYEAVLTCGARLRRGRGEQGPRGQPLRRRDRPRRREGRGRARVGRFRRRSVRPPLLAATAIGAALGAAGGEALHKKLGSGIGEKPPARRSRSVAPGSSSPIPRSAAEHGRARGDPRREAGRRRSRGHHVKALKGALADAQEKMAEGGS